MLVTVLEKYPGLPGQVAAGAHACARRRIYILPTRFGLFFSGLLLVMLIGAMNYSNSMAYALTFLLGGVLLVSMLHTYRNLRGLLISTPAPRPVYAGETMFLPLLLDNRSGLRRIALTIEAWPEDKRQRRRLASAPLLINLAPAAMRRENLAIKAVRRGYLRPEALKISSQFPLGLFQAWSYVKSDQVGLVYPRPAGSRDLPPYSEYATEEQQGKKTGTDDFTGFKPYRHGDSIRNIDWKAFAKEQALQVKRFSGSGASRLLLRWDHCGPGADVERRLSQLCRWALRAEQEGYYFGLEIPEARIELGKGEVHLQRCLTLLAGYGLADRAA
jgi:uncharacterized protein (DUF58 family)